MSVEDIARRFVEAINRHDPEAMFEMVEEDYRHIDSEGQIFDGRDEMSIAWKSFLKTVPDYTIEVSETFVSQGTVILVGKVMGTVASGGEEEPEDFWQTPTACRLVISGDRVREFQVFADNESMRNAMRRASGRNRI